MSENSPIKLVRLTPDHNFTDKWGAVMPEAVIAIHYVKVHSEQELTANYTTMQYDESGSVSGLSYNVNYWPNSRVLPAADETNPNPNQRPSRPFDAGDGVLVFTVDVSKYASLYDNYNGGPNESALEVCKTHFVNEVIPQLQLV